MPSLLEELQIARLIVCQNGNQIIDDNSLKVLSDFHSCWDFSVVN